MNIEDIMSFVNWDITTRITVSVVLGFIIGLERELTSKSAGLRTHILVCLGSTIFTILSIFAFPTMVSGGNPVAYGDPARIAAQILTGIGFIGGGTVLRHRGAVYGLTTAATLWMTASIGMAAGAGFNKLAIAATTFTIIILTLIRHLEIVLIRRHKKEYAIIKATLICKNEFTDEIIEEINNKLKNICEISEKKCDREENFDKIIVVFEQFNLNPFKKSYEIIKGIQNVDSISLKQHYKE